MCDVRSGDCLTQKRFCVEVQTIQRHKKWDKPLWCVEASTSANLVNAVHKGMDLTPLKFLQQLHEVQVYPSKGNW